MKKGFTLVEMLIVVVVLVTLMTIMFRLSSIGGEQRDRNTTISRLQRVENCLSGYYAAFGTYPPVRLHGSRNYNLPVNYLGIQQMDGGEQKLSFSWYKDSGDHGIGSNAERRDWVKVCAACKSQPVAARFPYPEGYNEVLKARAELARERLAAGEDTDSSAEHAREVNGGYDDGYTDNPGRHDLDEEDWTESQLFQFGLMSYLLPRYFIMMNGEDRFFTQGAQWQGSNTPPTDPLYGTPMSWSDVKRYAENCRRNSNDKESWARLAYIPSQAVCARWLPNLEKSCVVYHSKPLFGINVAIENGTAYGMHSVFAPGGSQNPNSGSQYALDFATVVDGWNYELFYYSPPPYQSYILWSAGPNHRTFPPWASREDFDGKENKCIGAWIEDDIIHMSN